MILMITANDSNTAHIQKTTLGANVLFASAEPLPFFPPSLSKQSFFFLNCEPFFPPIIFPFPVPLGWWSESSAVEFN